MKEQMTKKLCVNKYVKKSTNSKMMSLCHDDNDNEDDSGDDNHDGDDNADNDIKHTYQILHGSHFP